MRTRLSTHLQVFHQPSEEPFMLSRRSMLIAAIGASAATLTPAFAASPRPFDAQAFADAQKAGRPILIAIHASWCPTCKAQKPILGELTDEPKFKSLAYFLIDFDSQKDLVQRFGACMQSTLVAFRGSREEGRSVGDTNRASIAELLNKTL
jgi:thioredoxin 1